MDADDQLDQAAVDAVLAFTAQALANGWITTGPIESGVPIGLHEHLGNHAEIALTPEGKQHLDDVIEHWDANRPPTMPD